MILYINTEMLKVWKSAALCMRSVVDAGRVGQGGRREAKGGGGKGGGCGGRRKSKRRKRKEGGEGGGEGRERRG